MSKRLFINIFLVLIFISGLFNSLNSLDIYKKRIKDETDSFKEEIEKYKQEINSILNK